ncbi:hypothetical protein Y032_0054g2442 [Ancylostoma ceylanicum]|uniref:G-protein coupled receptors family 1 profile domain-containing protein n=1 Tax=Ancylostoma ceylanicum TaxID=53326 RepID=A0A016U6P7_9BILA|nr:hypothetical protein Y032_0054g2442 [Ancylostoma ceylanicum]
MPRMAERLAGTFVGPDNMVGTPEEQRRISVYEFPSHNPPHIVIRSRANSMALPPRSVSPTSRKYTLVDTGSGVLELESEKNDLFDIIQEANMDGVRHLKADDALSRYIWCFIIVIFVILALIQIYYQIMLFYSEPVATNIEVEYPSTIAFPTVAICNNNQFRKGLILHKGCAGIRGGFPSFLLQFLPCTYFPIISFATLCPFHSCLNEPSPSSCLHTPVDPYHFSYHNSQINICHSERSFALLRLHSNIDSSQVQQRRITLRRTFILGYIVPLILIVFFNWKLIRKLCVHKRILPRSAIPLRRVVMYTVLIAAVYFVCWTPYWFSVLYAIVMSLAGLPTTNSELLLFVIYCVHLLPYFGSSSNWILYGLLNTQLQMKGENSSNDDHMSIITMMNTNNHHSEMRVARPTNRSVGDLAKSYFDGSSQSVVRYPSSNGAALLQSQSDASMRFYQDTEQTHL